MNTDGITLMDKIDVGYLDERWLDGEGRIKLLPAEEFRSVPADHLRLWMHYRARYSLPTLELVEWLKFKIGPRTAIEIGSGNGDLYHHLKIPGTDSFVQVENNEVSLYYALSMQMPTRPREDVMKIDANEAVESVLPDVVVASYVTRKYIDGAEDGVVQASVYGVLEEDIIRKVKCYIHIGNEASHSQKTALRLAHETLRPEWMVTRGDPSRDVIYVWGQ